jgi:cysteine desulfurase / selenocysteine lyase
MIAEGRVYPDRVEYGPLPWKFAAGTPDVLGTIVSAQALRLLLDLALTPRRAHWFVGAEPIERADVEWAMSRIAGWHHRLIERALDRLTAVPGITVYGPADPARRAPLVAFNADGQDPVQLARALNMAGVEARAGCHCATLAHRALCLDPPASCRLSFALYNTLAEVDRAVDAVAAVLAALPRRRVAIPRPRMLNGQASRSQAAATTHPRLPGPRQADPALTEPRPPLHTPPLHTPPLHTVPPG